MVKKQNFVDMDRGSFIVQVKTDDIYNDIEEDVETRFETSNYEIDRPLPKAKKKVIGLMKDKLSVKNKNKNCWIKSKYLHLLNI